MVCKQPLTREEAFVVHGNARLAPKGRWEMAVRVLMEEEAVSRVARDMGVTRETVYKWVRRYQREGLSGLLDRSSRPHSSPGRAAPETERAVMDARRRLRAGPARIAAATGTAERTVTRILRRNGVLRLWDCDPLSGEPKQPVRKGSGIRYEHPYAGDLGHMDTKKIAAIFPRRGMGRARAGKRRPAGSGLYLRALHRRRPHPTGLLPDRFSDEKAPTVVGFLTRALENYRQHGITHIREIMTDNHLSYTRNRLFKRSSNATGSNT